MTLTDLSTSAFWKGLLKITCDMFIVADALMEIKNSNLNSKVLIAGKPDMLLIN